MTSVQEANIFYNELLNKKIIEKNDGIHYRLTEVLGWRSAFVTIMKHTKHFNFKISKKNKLVWEKALKKHGFNDDQITSILDNVTE